jgi:hypothetical protein
VVVGALVLVFAVVPAPAGVVDLGAGWQASWDDSLNGLVDIPSEVGGGGDTLFIQKWAKFNQGPDPDTGLIPPILIEFQQTDPAAATHIVIDDEIITNNTGVTWTDFHMRLVDPSGGTVFDPVATAGSHGTGPIGWTIDPFTLAVFTGTQRLDIWGGAVSHVSPGNIWYPGNGAYNGQLWINVTPQPDNSASFVLVERPTTTGIPEPVSLALLGIGGVALLGRRRS